MFSRLTSGGVGVAGGGGGVVEEDDDEDEDDEEKREDNSRGPIRVVPCCERQDETAWNALGRGGEAIPRSRRTRVGRDDGLNDERTVAPPRWIVQRDRDVIILLSSSSWVFRSRNRYSTTRRVV